MNPDPVAVLAAPDVEPDDPPVPPLLERVLGLLVSPWLSFRLHHGGWGWVAPWLIVSCLGVVAGVANVANGKLEVLIEGQIERQQAQLDAKGIEVPPEALDFQRKLGIFSVKVGSVIGPPLWQLWHMVMFGTVVFVFALVWGDPGRVDVMRCFSLAAWCGLAQGVGYVALTLASIAGSPVPATSLVHVVDQLEQPLAAALLGRLDPVVIYYYVLLAIGLHGSCRVPRAISGWAAGGCFAAVTLLQAGLSSLSRLQGG